MKLKRTALWIVVLAGVTVGTIYVLWAWIEQQIVWVKPVRR